MWETEYYLYCIFIVLTSAPFLFTCWSLCWLYGISTVWKTSTLVSWKPNKKNKMCPCTDYVMDNLWEWVTDAENKPTFDTISPLVFDICSTITFHGKGEFKIITCQSTEASAGFSSKRIRLHQHACSGLIKTWGWMKVLIVSWQAYSSFSPSLSCCVSNLHRDWVGQGAGREAWGVRWPPPLLCHPPSVCSPHSLSLQKYE